MTPLGQRLAQRIAREGPLAFDQFMAAALGDASDGYYMTRDPLGAAGDFTTAPEVSQMFGELLGLWLADQWQHMGQPAPFVLAEFGPGRGTLMADVLRALATVPACRAAAVVHLVETSPVLRRRQASLLADAGATWHDSAAGLPAGPLLAVASEFFDAVPVRQFVRTPAGWRERLVACDGAVFSFTTAPTALDDATIALRATAPEGAIVEARPAATRLAGELGARVAADGGAVMIVDYGYRGPAIGDTVQAVRGHQPAEVFDAPGEVDLSAHVDFTALAGAADAGGASVHGPVAQRDFLRRLGIEARAEILRRGANAAQSAAIDAALERLLAPAEMGTLFQVLALADPRLPTPAGF